MERSAFGMPPQVLCDVRRLCAPPPRPMQHHRVPVPGLCTLCAPKMCTVHHLIADEAMTARSHFPPSTAPPGQSPTRRQAISPTCCTTRHVHGCSDPVPICFRGTEPFPHVSQRDHRQRHRGKGAVDECAGDGASIDVSPVVHRQQLARYMSWKRGGPSLRPRPLSAAAGHSHHWAARRCSNDVLERNKMNASFVPVHQGYPY